MKQLRFVSKSNQVVGALKIAFPSSRPLAIPRRHADWTGLDWTGLDSVRNELSGRREPSIKEPFDSSRLDFRSFRLARISR